MIARIAQSIMKWVTCWKAVVIFRVGQNSSLPHGFQYGSCLSTHSFATGTGGYIPGGNAAGV
jgi:hypothetical protein